VNISQTCKPPMLRTRFAALDGWRGIAAIMVSLLHFKVYNPMFDFGLVRHAALFVDFFFVLSGFVLMHAYSSRIYSRSDLAAFIVKRLARLWPNHFVVLSLFIGVQIFSFLLSKAGLQLHQAPFTENYSFSSILTNLLLLHPLGLHSSLTWNYPSWTIAVEFWTYILFGTLLLAWRPAFTYFAAISAIASLALLISFSPNYLLVGNNFGLFRCILGFFIGCLTYRLHSFFMHQVLRAATVCEVVITAFALMFVLLAGENAASFAAPFVFALVVLIFARGGGKVSSLLCAPGVQFFGKISFSIYIIHAFVHMVFFQILRVLSTRVDGIAVLPVTAFGYDGSDQVVLMQGSFGLLCLVLYLVGVSFSAWVLWRYVEVPCERKLSTLMISKLELQQTPRVGR